MATSRGKLDAHVMWPGYFLGLPPLQKTPIALTIGVLHFPLTTTLTEPPLRFGDDDEYQTGVEFKLCAFKRVGTPGR